MYGMGYSLPESVRIVILQALGSKAELERGNGPFGKVANVRPWQHRWPPNCVHNDNQWTITVVLFYFFLV